LCKYLNIDLIIKINPDEIGQKDDEKGYEVNEIDFYIENRKE